MPIASIILAAGASRRLGRPKQLVTYGGETLLARAIRLAHEAGALPVLVVLGAEYEAIHAAIEWSFARAVRNTDWEQGIASSIHAGLRASEEFAPDAAGAMMLACDQPRLTAEHLRALIGLFEDRGEAAIVASMYAGVHGVPAIFPRAAFAELRALSGDKGARALLVKPPCAVVAVDLAGGEIDLDTPEDLAGLAG